MITQIRPRKAESARHNRHQGLSAPRDRPPGPGRLGAARPSLDIGRDRRTEPTRFAPAKLTERRDEFDFAAARPAAGLGAGAAE